MGGWEVWGGMKNVNNQFREVGTPERLVCDGLVEKFYEITQSGLQQHLQSTSRNIYLAPGRAVLARPAGLNFFSSFSQQ